MASENSADVRKTNSSDNTTPRVTLFGMSVGFRASSRPAKLHSIAMPAPNTSPLSTTSQMSRVESALLPRYIYSGAHIGRRNVLHTRGRVVRAEKTAWRDALLDIDGEALGKLDATFTVVPGAIRVLEQPG